MKLKSLSGSSSLPRIVITWAELGQRAGYAPHLRRAIAPCLDTSVFKCLSETLRE